MRRKFGVIAVKPNKTHPKWLEASYPTPTFAFARWGGQPQRQSKVFSLEDSDAAGAWLSTARKRLDADVWEPENVVKARELGNRMTFNEYAPQWLDNRRTKEGKPIRPGTRHVLESSIRLHILPFFGNDTLISVDEDAYERWLAWLPQEGQAMRANAAKALLAMLRSASKPGPKGERPLIPRMPDLQTPPKPKKQHVTIPATVEEIRVIIKAMPERYALTIPLSVTCGGLRIGEVCPLQRKHLLNDFTVLDIAQGRPTMGPDKVGPTKTGNSDRREPIPSVMGQMLRELCDKYGITDPDDFLFPAVRKPNDPLHPNTLRGWYEEARALAGRPDLRFHDLRHTAASMLNDYGASLREIMDAGGWGDSKTALSYQHPSTERRLELAERLGSLLPEAKPLESEAHPVVESPQNVFTSLLAAMPPEAIVEALKTMDDGQKQATIAALPPETQQKVILTLV